MKSAAHPEWMTRNFAWENQPPLVQLKKKKKSIAADYDNRVAPPQEDGQRTTTLLICRSILSTFFGGNSLWSLEIGFTASTILSFRSVLKPEEVWLVTQLNPNIFFFYWWLMPTKTFESSCDTMNLGLLSILTASHFESFYYYFWRSLLAKQWNAGFWPPFFLLLLFLTGSSIHLLIQFPVNTGQLDTAASSSSHCHSLHLSVMLVLAPSHSSRPYPHLMTAAVAHPLRSERPSIHLLLSHPPGGCCLRIPHFVRLHVSPLSLPAPTGGFSLLRHLQNWMLMPITSALLKFSLSRYRAVIHLFGRNIQIHIN